MIKFLSSSSSINSSGASGLQSASGSSTAASNGYDKRRDDDIYALEEIIGRFIEAAQRGLWKADADMLERLNEIYNEVEAVLEADVTGEVQGGSIDVYTYADVPQWGEAVKRVEKALAKIRR